MIEPAITPRLNRLHLLGALGGIGFLTFFFIGFWPLAHFLPGHDPSASADTIAGYYRGNAFGIRLGMICLQFGAMCYLLFIVGCRGLMRRIEHDGTVLSDIQFAGGIVSSVFLFVPTIFWGITAFRPERAPELTLLLNDASWLLLITAVPPFLLQTFPFAIAILRSREAHPPLPRWFAYLTLWGDIIYAPGLVAYFAKSGPFAWNGLFPYWLPFFGYGGWILVTVVLLIRAVRVDTQPN